MLCQYFYPEYVSSATLPTQLSEDLINAGFKVDVICGMPKEYVNEKKIEKREKYNGINIRRLNYTEFNNKSKVGRIINFFSLFVAFGLKISKMLKYNHILVYSNPPILPLIPDIIHRLTKKKYSFVVYDIAPDNAIKTGSIKPGGLIDKTMKFINKRVYKNATNVIVLDNEMKRYLIENKISKTPDNIKVIPNWYDDKQIKHDKILNPKFKDLRNHYKKIVLYSGNMGQLQDMETIMDFLMLNKENNDVLTVLTGHGVKQKDIMDFIERNSINNAVVYGFLTGTDYSDVLVMADICIVSLVKEGKGLGVPSKIYGYLATKNPIIAILDSNSDIVKEIEQYNAGIHIDNGNANKLFEFVNTVELEELKQQGQNAYQLFERNYTRKISTAKYIELLQ